MKSEYLLLYLSLLCVASFTEAWIEITQQFYDKDGNIVASFTEAWIEINLGKNENEGEQVASFTEAWIEISSQMV